jgi:hypothetical protein
MSKNQNGMRKIHCTSTRVTGLSNPLIVYYTGTMALPNITSIVLCLMVSRIVCQGGLHFTFVAVYYRCLVTVLSSYLCVNSSVGNSDNCISCKNRPQRTGTRSMGCRDFTFAHVGSSIERLNRELDGQSLGKLPKSRYPCPKRLRRIVTLRDRTRLVFKYW